MKAYATKTAAKRFRLSPIAFPRLVANIKAPVSYPRGYDTGAKCLTTARYCLAKNANATAPGPTCVPMVPPTVE